MTIWIVPFLSGKKDSLKVSADNEWDAQRQAAEKMMQERWVGTLTIDHAVPLETKVCNWGCCRLR